MTTALYEDITFQTSVSDSAINVSAYVPVMLNGERIVACAHTASEIEETPVEELASCLRSTARVRLMLQLMQMEDDGQEVRKCPNG